MHIFDKYTFVNWCHRLNFVRFHSAQCYISINASASKWEDQVATSSGHPRFQGSDDRRRVSDEIEQRANSETGWSFETFESETGWSFESVGAAPVSDNLSQVRVRPQHSIRFIPPSLVSMWSSLLPGRVRLSITCSMWSASLTPTI